MIKINVASFMRKPQGSREVFDMPLEIDAEIKKELHLPADPTARIEMLKLPHEINVSLKNLRAGAQLVCSRCLRKFVYEISIPFAEREFSIDLQPSDMEKGEDVFYVKNAEIILDEMIRQEIILHFPGVALCSLSCKGLCGICGADLNKKPCFCKDGGKAQNSPFKFLSQQF